MMDSGRKSQEQPNDDVTILPESVPVVHHPTEKVSYDKEGVFIHIAAEDSEDLQIPGHLRLVSRDDVAMVEWQPVHMADFQTEEELDWAVVNPAHGEDKNATGSSARKPPHADCAFRFSLTDLRAVERARAALGWQHLTFKLRNNECLTPLHFHGTPMNDFWSSLGRFVVLTRSAADGSWYDVTDAKDGALESMSPHDAADRASLANLFSEEALYSGFSRVTRFVRHLGSEVGITSAEASEPVTLAETSLSIVKTEGSPSDLSSPMSPRDDTGYEMVEPSQLSKLPLWDEAVSREEPIGLEEWQDFLDSEGRVVRENDFRRRLFKGGVKHEIRHYVWKFLLGFYDFDSTATCREESLAKRRDDYTTMKQQWKSMLPCQMKRFGLLRDRRHLIQKDVTRTDRTHPRFVDDDSVYLVRLSDVLTTYCFYNFDLGYVQGMSDLCAPILDILEDEVEAFWCFAGFLDIVEENFSEDQEAMRQQLMTLQAMLRVVDPQMSDYLATQDSDNLYFCFRWLLVLFKRELTFADTMRLWEIFWSNYLTQHFHLFFALAILLQSKDVILKNRKDFNDIVKFVNELSGHIDVEQTLVNAEVLCLRFIAGRSVLPDIVSKLLPEKELSAMQLTMMSDSLEQHSITCLADGSSVLSVPNQS